MVDCGLNLKLFTNLSRRICEASCTTDLWGNSLYNDLSGTFMCVKECGPGKELNTALNACVNIDCNQPVTFCAYCEVSNGPCLKCESGKYLNSQNKCVASCESSYFADTNLGKCIKCSDNC